MTNLKLLKSKMLLSGFESFNVSMAGILECGLTTAQFKMQGKSEFKQSEIIKIIDALHLTRDEVMEIFFEGR